MRNTILLSVTLGVLALAGCAHEKSFEVTGIVPPSQMREETRATAVPRPRLTEPFVVKAPQRDNLPNMTFQPATRPAPKPQRVPRPAVATFPDPVSPPAGSQPKVTLVPDSGLVGKVASVNASLHFVVLNFPVGRMAAIDQTLTLYRQGEKIGEVKVTGPQQDDNIIADVVSGEAEAGDEVREK